MKKKKLTEEPQGWEITTPVSKTPYKCPICNGNGMVPDGFYNQTSGQWSSTGTVEKCRSCNGTGIVWG